MMGQEFNQPSLAIPQTIPAPDAAGQRNDLRSELRKKARPGEAIIQVFLRFSGLLSVLITAGIVLVLVYDAWVFFQRPEVTLWMFFTGTAWQPRIGQFGIFPLFNATVLSSIIGLAVALPVGWMIAIYLSEYASH